MYTCTFFPVKLLHEIKIHKIVAFNLPLDCYWIAGEMQDHNCKLEPCQ